MLESEGDWQVWKDGWSTEVNGSSATVSSASALIRLWVLQGENSASNRTKAITHTSNAGDLVLRQQWRSHTCGTVGLCTPR